MSKLNTVGNAWMVCIQFRKDTVQRFAFYDEAKQYANLLAMKYISDVVEIFECKANLQADIPVRVTESQQ